MIRKRLTFANVASAAALFVSLATGGAYATHELINSSDIVNGTVASADLRNDDVRSDDIKNQNVRGAEVLDNSLTGSDVDEASLGDGVNATKLGGRDWLGYVHAERGHSQVFVGSVETGTGADSPNFQIHNLEFRGSQTDDVLSVCNFVGRTFGAVTYTGGSTSSTAATRDYDEFSPGECNTFNAQGGDFQVYGGRAACFGWFKGILFTNDYEIICLGR